MKIRLCIALLLASFCTTLFTGCAAATVPLQPMDSPGIVGSTEPLTRDISPVATPAATGPSSTQPQYISEEDAQNIALKHAGRTANDVTRLKAEFDFDDGKAEYDVEFRYGGYEYDYKIHAETGRIISWNKDLND